MKKNILIVGATGSIGHEFTKHYDLERNVEKIFALSRRNNDFDSKKIHPVIFDYNKDETFEDLIDALNNQPINTIIIATGLLHNKDVSPEKSVNNISVLGLNQLFHVNVFGPMLLIKKLLPLIKQSTLVKIIFLTARVGSITDNKLGGWYSYRSSKAALNMMIRTLSIELQRIKKENIVIGMHPGTVDSNLSKPFLKNVNHQILSPKESVAHMVKVIHRIKPEDSGNCFDIKGNVIDP